jgi:hypothetical protein
VEDDGVQNSLVVMSIGLLMFPPWNTHDSLLIWYGLREGWDEGDVCCIIVVILKVDQWHLRMATVKGGRK